MQKSQVSNLLDDYSKSDLHRHEDINRSRSDLVDQPIASYANQSVQRDGYDKQKYSPICRGTATSDLPLIAEMAPKIINYGRQM